MKHKLIFILFSVVNAFTIVSQSTVESVFNHIGYKDGLLSSQILDIEKNNSNYLWLGTEKGLIRYDGHTFKSFIHDSADTFSISGNYVNEIMMDKNQNLWCANTGKISWLDTKTLRFHNYKEDYYNAKFALNSQNGSVYFVSGQNLYSIRSYGAINKIEIPNVSDKYTFTCLVTDKRGNVYVGTTNGIYVLNKDLRVIRHFQTLNMTSRRKPTDDVFNMMIDESKNILWVGGWSYGLIKINLTTNKQSQYFYRSDKLQNAIYKIIFNKFDQDPDRLWLGTLDGLYSFNVKTEKFQSYKSSILSDKYGVSGLVFSLYSDDEQFWIGTYQGLNVMHRADQDIKKLSFDESSYNRNLPIRAFVISPSGNKDDKEGWFLEGSKLKKFWFTDSGLLAKENGLSEINKKDYHNIDIDSKQRLWLFSSKGLFYLKENILFTPSLTDKDNIYYQMVDDLHGTVWFTSLGGLYYYHEDSGKILKDTSVMMTLENKFGNRYLSSIVANSKNDKLMVFKGGSLSNQQLVFQSRNKLSILNKKDHNKLNNLENLEGAIFINDTTFIVYSTNGALLGKKVDGFIKIIDDHQFGKSLGLANLRNASRDRQGKIWFSTDFGICSFDFEKYGLRSYNYYNSKISTFIHPDIRVSPNSNKIYSADFNGLLQFPNEEFVSSSPPCVTELSINNFDNYELLNKKDKLRLKYYQNTLSFSFSNFDFYNPDVHEYEFKLNENSWQTFQKGKLRFEKLSDGDYNLSVRVRNSKGIMHSKYFNLKFEIRPPFYKTIWFNIFLLFLGFVILYLFFKYREIQRQKLIDLRYNIARDLHDDLGSNLSNIKLISEREAQKNQNAQFSSIADQMRKAMISMSEIVWSINPQNDRIEDVLLKIQEYMIHVCEDQNIDLRFEIEDLQIKRNMNPDDKRNLFLIFKEALNNVIKYSNASQVTFSAKQNFKHIYLSIKDNGKGFNYEKVKLGNGIKNMEARAMALDGKININSSSEGTLIELFL